MKTALKVAGLPRKSAIDGIGRIEDTLDKPTLPSEYKESSDAYGLKAFWTVVCPMLALIVAAPLTWLYISPWTVILIWFALGVLSYKQTIVMHECAHRTLFKTKKYNELLGHFCGILLLSDFLTFRRLHWKHHTDYGENSDPQGRDYLHLSNASRGKILWHLIRPLFGFNLFKVAEFRTDKLANTNKPSNLKAKLKDKLLFILVQAVVVLTVTAGGKLWWLIALYPSAAGTVGLFLSQMRGFCEHIADPGHRSEAFVRTHLPNFLDKALFYTLNFNYHVEHHLYPAIPACHLPQVHEFIRPDVHNNNTVSTSIWNTLLNRLRKAGH